MRSSGPMPRSPVRSPRPSLRTRRRSTPSPRAPRPRAAAAELDELVGDRALLLRTDRIDPSKNVVRGFLAYERLLEEHPEWRERVVFVAMLNASRETLAEYAAYRQEVAQAVERVNRTWATAGWQPVVLDERDDFARSVAGLGRYDVLLVNPLKDGLNLVAKEGPLLNRRDGVVCLSPEAGAYDELHDAVLRTAPVRHRADGGRVVPRSVDAGGRTNCHGEPAPGARGRCARRATGSTNWSGRPGRQLADELLEQLGEPCRAAHHDVGPLQQLGRRLRRPDGDANEYVVGLFGPPRFAVEQVEDGEVAPVVARERIQRRAIVVVPQPLDGCPLVDRDRGPELAGHAAGLGVEAVAGGQVGQRARVGRGAGRGAPVDGERDLALALDEQVRARCARASSAAAATASRYGVTLGSTTIRPSTSVSSPY